MSQDTHIEGLEKIVARLVHGGHGAYADHPPSHNWFAQKLLADPAILAHIPAYKALHEERDRFKQGFERTCEIENHLNSHVMELESQRSALQEKVERFPMALSEANTNRMAMHAKIATLEATNAAQAERIGELEAGLREFLDFYDKPCNIDTPRILDDKQFGEFLKNLDDNRDAMVAKARALLSTTHPVSANQPDSGKVPHGYALVPIEPNMATSGAMVQAYMSGFRRSLPLGKKLALAWAAGIKESELKDA